MKTGPLPGRLAVRNSAVFGLHKSMRRKRPEPEKPEGEMPGRAEQTGTRGDGQPAP